MQMCKDASVHVPDRCMREHPHVWMQRRGLAICVEHFEAQGRLAVCAQGPVNFPNHRASARQRRQKLLRRTAAPRHDDFLRADLPGIVRVRVEKRCAIRSFARHRRRQLRFGNERLRKPIFVRYIGVDSIRACRQRRKRDLER